MTRSSASCAFPASTGSAYAEYVAAPASDLARKPAGIDHVHAAGAPMAGLTAWQFLIELGHDHPSPFQAARHRPTALDADTTVLINGAAGGVGHFALQLAKWKGARVIAVASGAHESFLRELGADEFIDYTKSRPEELVHDVDLVLDTVGGPDSRRFLRTLKRGGALFPVFSATSTKRRPRSWASRSRAPRSARTARSLPNSDACSTRARSASRSTARFALADARAAHERAARGHIQGKIVLTVA